MFAASCSTCHGARGLGGYASWVNAARSAPRVARGLGSTNPNLEMRYKQTIRNGSYYDGGFRHAMPAFGEAVLSDSDLDALVKWLLYAAPLGGSDAVNGVPAPERPSGREIVLEIIDEAPWFKDDGRDDRDPFSDSRRVILSEGDYVKVVNRGKTWHTVTNRAAGVDTGF
ncbi:MAG: cytochrome c, partial [Nitrospirae bacterium]|nr:cytochrome c [Fimbriimonadaceae bacterium]